MIEARVAMFPKAPVSKYLTNLHFLSIHGHIFVRIFVAFLVHIFVPIFAFLLHFC